jgi:methylglutaconyl-CoA hydratase
LFGAEPAFRLGLIDEVTQTLDAAVEKQVAAHLEASPSAVAATKKLIAFVDTHDIDTAKEYTAEALADAWETEDGREGIASFLAKRLPRWRSGA